MRELIAEAGVAWAATDDSERVQSSHSCFSFQIGIFGEDSVFSAGRD